MTKRKAKIAKAKTHSVKGIMGIRYISGCPVHGHSRTLENNMSRFRFMCKGRISALPVPADTGGR